AAVQVIADPDRALVADLLEAHDLIDLVVPRGGAELIDHVRRHATMPVVAHGEAVVQMYIDAGADLQMAVKLVDNAKTRRYSICNAVDTLLVHREIAPSFLDALARQWGDTVTFIGDGRALSLLSQDDHPGIRTGLADDATWRTE